MEIALTNYSGLATTISIAAGQTVDLGELILTKPQGSTTGTIRGLVTDAASGQPLPGAVITVNGNAAAAVTAADGTFEIANVTPGPVAISATKPGYASVTANGDLKADSVLLFSPALVVGTSAAGVIEVRGSVTDGLTGLSLEGVAISVGGNTPSSTLTDTQGQYRLTGLVPGTAQLQATYTGYDSVTATAQLADNSVVEFSPRLYPQNATPPLANTAGISGVVLDAGNNRPLVSVAISANYNGSAHTFVTGADGRFTIEGITSPNAELGFGLSGYQGSSLSVSLPPLATLDVGQVRLRKDKVLVLRPDLAVMAADRSTAHADPQTLILTGAVTAHIANLGTAEAPAGVAVLAFRDDNRNNIFDAGTDIVLGSTQLTPALAPAADTSVAIPVAGDVLFRDAPISVWVDSEERVVELREDNNLRSTASSAEVKPNSKAFKPVLKWAWNNGQVIATPVAGPLVDTNADGKVDDRDTPAVVFVRLLGIDFAPGVLTAVSGKDGHELWSVPNPYTGSETAPALGDIDGDGRPEVVMYIHGGGMAAINGDGSLKWKSSYPPGTGGYNYGAPSIADLDGDGKAEIAARNFVINHDGSLRFQFDPGFNAYYGHTSVSVIADLDLDGKPEVIAGSSAVHGDGRVYWTNPKLASGGRRGIGDFDGDGFPEIVDVSGQSALLLNHDGTVRWGPVTLSGAYNGGAPTVADMDGDGIPDIGIAGAAYYSVLNSDGSLKWRSSVSDGSGATGSTVFDFDGDGKAEVVYCDETTLRVYEGATGKVLFSVPNSSATALEYPIVADVDHDGHADILVPQNGRSPGLRVFQDESNAWVNTRSIWNQYNYHITNINEDGSIPRVEANSWQVHNTYRLNARPGISATAVPDLTASYLRVRDRGGISPSTFTVRIGNGGGMPVDAGVAVAFYNGPPETGGVLVGVAKTRSRLETGVFEDVSIDHPGALNGISQIVAVADDDGAGHGAVTDFDRGNNRVSLPLAAFHDALSVSVDGDQLIYPANSPVRFTAQVTNGGSFPAAALVRFTVESADTGAEVAPPHLADVVTVFAGGAQAVEWNWNTGTYYSGSYLIQAELVDDDGLPFARATSGFTVVGEISPTVSAGITTDKATYSPADTVQLTDRIVNLTANRALDGLFATTMVTHPDGTPHWNQTQSLPQLTPSALKDLNYSLPLAMAPAGDYAVSLVVTDGQGQELARSATRFTVLSTTDTGSGLTGVLTATPNSSTLGDPVSLQLGVDNLGNADLNGLPISLAVVDPQAQTQLAGWSYATDLARQGGYRNQQAWATAGLTPGTYVAVLSATIAGSTKVLAHANISLTEPPIRFTLDDGIDRGPRLLVWLGCREDDEDDHEHDEETDDHHHKAQRSTAQNSSQHDDHGEDEATCGCNDGRRQALEPVLDRLGVRYRIVRHVADFRSAFRSGRYNIYWLSGVAEELPETLAGELREAVYRGDGLLLERGLEHEDRLLDALAGSVVTGKYKIATTALNLDGPLFTPGRLPVQGEQIRLRVTDGLVQAHFDDAAPAIISHDFGSGHVLTLAFDGVGNLATQTDAAWPAWAQQAFDSLQPTSVPAPFLPRAYLPLQARIQNQGQATDLQIETMLPAGFELVDSNPPPTNQGGGRWLQTLHLAVGQQLVTELGLRLPETFGVFEIATTARSSGTNPVIREAHLSVEIADREALAKTLTDALKALKLNRTDGKQRDRAMEAIRKAQSAWNKADAETAIDRLLEAAEALRRIGGAGAQAELLQLDRLLQAAELQWRDLEHPVCSREREGDDVSAAPDSHQTASDHAHR